MGGQTMYTDADDLTVGTVNISALTLNGVTVPALSVTGITTSNDDVTLTVLANDLRIEQAVNAGTGDLLLDVTGKRDPDERWGYYGGWPGIGSRWRNHAHQHSQQCCHLRGQ